MAPTQAAGRKLRGDFPTPPALVERVVEAVMPDVVPGQPVRILDPACGDGRFLVAAAEWVIRAGGRPVVCGVDVHREAVADARAAIGGLDGVADVDLAVGDALTLDWAGAAFDVVLGNPPYLSQLAASTTRGRASGRGGGPYADVAAEFLVLAVERARSDGGRIGLVLPQSILGSRDTRAIRDAVDRRADMIWSWWSPTKVFDADVFVCALGFQRRRPTIAERGNSPGRPGDRQQVWSDVIVRSLGVPPLPAIVDSGTTGDRARFTANFRGEYYGMAPAVGDHDAGPKLVTSGLIDPNRCWWGERPVRFNGRPFLRPRLDVAALDDRMQAWVRRMSVPKVLVANQTRVVECVIDVDGSTVPGVPVVTGRPHDTAPRALAMLAAVLSSPFASAWVWHRVAGTGLSARTVRLGPAVLAALPWPAAPVGAAVAAWQRGDLDECAARVHESYAIDPAASAELIEWWRSWRP